MEFLIQPDESMEQVRQQAQHAIGPCGRLGLQASRASAKTARKFNSRLFPRAKKVPNSRTRIWCAQHPEWHKAAHVGSPSRVFENGNAIRGQGVGTNSLLFHLFAGICIAPFSTKRGLSCTYDFTLKVAGGVKAQG